MKDTVAIIGSHPRTRGEFDFSRTDCDIWVFNEAMSTEWATRADAVFQMHEETIWKNPRNRNDPKHYNWLKSGNTPTIYMQDKYPEIPKAEKYPLDDVKKLFGNIRPYITSSIAYAVLLAIHNGYKRIEIFGVELETETEWFYQRTGYAMVVGIAIGRGIEVVEHSEILQSPLYGYEGDITLSPEVLNKRLEELNPQCKTAFDAYEEKRKEAADILHKFMETGEEPTRVPIVYGELINLGADFGLLDGARQEVQRYIDKAKAMQNMTGKVIFSRQEFESARGSASKQLQQEILKAGQYTRLAEKEFQEIAKIKNQQKRRYKVQKFLPLLDSYVRANVTASILQGGTDENHKLAKLLDDFIRAAGGQKSLEVLKGEDGQASC